jgi:hypothetical protein
VGTANSQRKSPRSSAKSERSTASVGDAPVQPRRSPIVDDEDYMDRSSDLVARVQAAKEVAQRQMESFGDPSEYDTTIIHGQKGEEWPAATQAALDFESDDGSDTD